MKKQNKRVWRRWACWGITTAVLCNFLLFCASAVEVYHSIPNETKRIALTFDDGPRADTTARLLDGLRQRGASATYCLVGEPSQQNPDLVRRMAAEGHQVGNHSWSHRMLQGIPEWRISQELNQTDTLLRELLGEGSDAGKKNK